MTAPRQPPGDLERLVRAGAVGQLSAVALGRISSEYVGAPGLQYLLPVVLGVLCGELVTAAAGTTRSATTSLGRWVRLVAVVVAVLGASYGVLDEGSSSPHQVWLPYVLAAAGAALWTLPNRRTSR